METKYILQPQYLISNAVDFSAKMPDTDFPISIFPAKIQNIINETHDCQGYPIDYIAASILTAIAVGIGNTHWVQIKRGWLESPILYMALVGRPGANKSHPLSFAMQPYIDYDFQQNLEYENEYAKYEKMMCMNRKERMNSGLDEYPQEPVRKRFIVSDTTPEALNSIHSENPRGLCLLTDELYSWINNFNRYSNNSSEEQFWLSVFSAKNVISDRKNKKSAIFIKHPFIAVVGTIQDKLLNEFAKGDRSHNGFIDRILFSIPKLQQKTRWNAKDLSEDVEKNWYSIINKLIRIECRYDNNNEIEPYIIGFTEDAHQKIYEWQHHCAECCDNESNDNIVSVYCKLEIYIIRFCLIIQISRWACGECDKEYIDCFSVQKAIELTEYFKNTALKIQNIINETTLSRQQKTILFQLSERFTTAQGLQIAELHGMKERAFKDFLSNNIGTLFQKEKHGEYSKI